MMGQKVGKKFLANCGADGSVTREEMIMDIGGGGKGNTSVSKNGKKSYLIFRGRIGETEVGNQKGGESHGVNHCCIKAGQNIIKPQRIYFSRRETGRGAAHKGRRAGGDPDTERAFHREKKQQIYGTRERTPVKRHVGRG